MNLNATGQRSAERNWGPLKSSLPTTLLICKEMFFSSDLITPLPLSYASISGFSTSHIYVVNFSVHSAVFLLICLSTHLSAHPPNHQSIYPLNQPPIHPSTHPPTRPAIGPSVCEYPSIDPSAHLPTHLSLYVSIHLAISRSHLPCIH